MGTIGQRIRWSRERLALSQEDIKEATGITEASLSRIENGIHHPRPSTLRKLAAVLQVSTTWLVTGEDTTAPARD